MTVGEEGEEKNKAVERGKKVLKENVDGAMGEKQSINAKKQVYHNDIDAPS